MAEMRSIMSAFHVPFFSKAISGILLVEKLRFSHTFG